MKRLISFIYFTIFNIRKRNIDYLHYGDLVTYNEKYENHFPLKNNMLYGNFRAVYILEKQPKFSFSYYIEHGIIFSKQIGASAYIQKKLKEYIHLILKELNF